MTVEELREEAKKLGYRISKIPEKVTRLPCVCGSKRADLWYDMNTHMQFFRCEKCGFTGKQAKKYTDAKKAWNESVKEGIDVKG